MPTLNINLPDPLQEIAGLTPSNDDLIQRKSGVWVNRTLSQLESDLTTFGRSRKFLLYDNTTRSHTGNTSETILIGNMEIPANTLGANDRLLIDAQIGAIGTAGTKTVRFYLNTTANTLVGATIIGTFQLIASAQSGGMRRAIANKNSQSANEVYPPTLSQANDLAAANATYTATNFNFGSNTYYFIVSVQNSSSSDTGSLRNIQIFNDRP